MTRDEMMQQKTEIERQYVTREGVIRQLGKFEGEPVWAVALYALWLEGSYASKEGGSQEEGTNAWAAFQVSEDFASVYLCNCSREACGEHSLNCPANPGARPFAVGIEETDQGFIYSRELTREEYNELDTPTRPSGYTDCPCRDCFEIAIDGDLCNECEEAGCSAEGDGECESPNAYGRMEPSEPHHDCNQIWAEMADPSCHNFEFEAWHTTNCARS